MFLIDLFIGAFPMFIVAYHIIITFIRSKNHDKTLLIIIANVLYGRFLKTCFKVQRNKIVKQDFLYQFRKFFNYLGSKYSFPSQHTIFYTYYFLRKLSVLNILFVLFICFGRVFYKHHTISDVFFGVFFGILFNLLVKKIENFYYENTEEQINKGKEA